MLLHAVFLDAGIARNSRFPKPNSGCPRARTIVLLINIFVSFSPPFIIDGQRVKTPHNTSITANPQYIYINHEIVTEMFIINQPAFGVLPWKPRMALDTYEWDYN